MDKHGIKILKVELFNWKNIEHRIIEFPKEKTIIQGDNSQGKSAIDQGILFCLFGGKKDSMYIRRGQSLAMVRVWAEVFYIDKYVLRKIETTINDKGTVQCSVLDENNMPLQNPRQVIKSYVNPQMFNPLDILGKDYKNNILRIVGCKVSKEELEKLKLPIPIDSIKFDSNGLDILNWIDNHLIKGYNGREALAREVKRTKGAYDTAKVEISEKTDAFQKQYGQTIENCPPSQSIMEQRVAIENSLKNMRSDYEGQKIEYDNKEAKVIMLKKRITSIEVEISKLSEKLLAQRDGLALIQKELAHAEQALEGQIRPDSGGAEEKILEQINTLQKHEAVSKEAEKIKEEKVALDAKQAEWDQSVKDHKHHSNVVYKETFMGFKNSKMKEIESQVEGLTVQDDGDLLWEGKKISTLSESERMILAVELQSKVLPKDSTIFIVIGELFDDKTIQRLHKIPQRIIVTRVGNSQVPGFDCQTITKEGTNNESA